MANVEFGTGKSVLILTIVAACFAILWPKIFYPMIVGTPAAKRPVDVSGGHLRQERPPHLRPEVLHPALRERGRAIPASHIVPKVTETKESGIKPPLPGMRPPMGGAGHVVPAPKTGGTMSIVMPLYTIGIVIFFLYTIMKVFVRKSSGEENLRDFQPDPEFRRVVFADETIEPTPIIPTKQIKEFSPPPSLLKKGQPNETTRLGWKERDTRDEEIDQLRRRLEETERAMERIVAQMGRVPRVAAASALRPKVDETKPGVESTEPEPEPAGKPTDQAVIDDASMDGLEGEVDQIGEGTQYTTANTAANPSAINAVNTASGRNDAEADDTAADLSAQDFLDDQEDLQEEYDAIWGAMEMEDDEAPNQLPQDLGQQHQR